MHERLCGYMLGISCQMEIEEEKREGGGNDLGCSKNNKLSVRLVGL